MLRVDGTSDGANVTYTWALGNGEISNGAVVSYIYPDIGFYTAVVTASNSVNALTATTSITVDESIVGLVVNNDSPTVLGQATTFTATVTTGSRVTYTWDLGDGTAGQRVVTAPARPVGEGLTNSRLVLSHTYATVGEYTAVFTASNSVGTASAAAMATIDEALAGLVATNDGPTVLGSVTILTATVLAGSNVTYTWIFDDGGIGDWPVVTHTYPATGIYIAVVTAGNSVSALTATMVVAVTEPGFCVYLPLVTKEH